MGVPCVLACRRFICGLTCPDPQGLMEHVDFMFLGSSGNSPCQSRQAAVEPRNTNALRRPEERPPRAPASYRFTASAPSRINESWVFHVPRLLGRGLLYDLPAPRGTYGTCVSHLFMCFGFSGVPWTYGLTYPPHAELMELMLFMCACVSASRALRGLMV